MYALNYFSARHINRVSRTFFYITSLFVCQLILTTLVEHYLAIIHATAFIIFVSFSWPTEHTKIRTAAFLCIFFIFTRTPGALVSPGVAIQRRARSWPVYRRRSCRCARLLIPYPFIKDSLTLRGKIVPFVLPFFSSFREFRSKG